MFFVQNRFENVYILIALPILAV